MTEPKQPGVTSAGQTCVEKCPDYPRCAHASAPVYPKQSGPHIKPRAGMVLRLRGAARPYPTLSRLDVLFIERTWMAEWNAGQYDILSELDDSPPVAPPTERSCTCGPGGSGTCEAHLWVEPTTTAPRNTSDVFAPPPSDDKPTPDPRGGPFPPSTRGTQENVGISPAKLYEDAYRTGWCDSRWAYSGTLADALADALKKAGL